MSTPDTSDNPLKVIYILGFARSGTTILGNLLGEMDGFLHVGELNRMWRRGSLSKDKCGCGHKMEDCSLWSRAINTAVGQPNGDGGTEQRKERYEHVWSVQRAAEGRTIWRDLMFGPRRNEKLRAYALLMENLLNAVAEATSARVLIDSSKRTKSSAYLRQTKGIESYYLHLIRDPRGAVLSRQGASATRKGDALILSPVTAIADCLRWVRGNISAGALGTFNRRHMSLRYEEFIARPEATLRQIAEWVGERKACNRLPLAGSSVARLGPNHTVGGNRNRFEIGEVPLRLDDRWRKSLRARDYMLITTLTSPLLVRYGYSLRRG